jgi:CubicO group peptidase (beta-lactamase class C family)
LIINVTDRRGPDMSASRPTQRSTGEVVKVAQGWLELLDRVERGRWCRWIANVRDREIDWSAAVGLGGQRIFVVPALDLVAIVNAGLYHSPMQAWVPLIVLNRYVLAATH